ncbi:MAG: hypothetical protein IJ527_05305 [Prevotella sp.]|nr:hypothetical protein [Prevotella sp.]
MARKETGMPFEVHPSPMKDAQGHNLLYARPMPGRSITIEDLDRQCCQNSAASLNFITNACNYLFSAFAEHLAEGRRIETPLGVFAPRLALRRGITDPAAVHATDVEWRGVDFLPSKALMQAIDQRSYGFHRAPDCRTRRGQPTQQQLLSALQQSMRNLGGYATVSSFAYHSQLSKNTARKWLNQQCEGEQPLLARQQMGTTFIYTLRS